MQPLQNLVFKLNDAAVKRESMLRLNSSIAKVENLRKTRGRKAFVSVQPYLDSIYSGVQHPECRLRKTDPELYHSIKALWENFKEAARCEFGSSGEWGKFSNHYCRFRTRIGNMDAVYSNMRGMFVEVHQRMGELKTLAVCFYIVPPSNFGAAADLLVADSASPEEASGKPLQAVYNIRYWEDALAGLENQLSKFEVPLLQHPEIAEKQKEKNSRILNVSTLVGSPLKLYKGK